MLLVELAAHRSYRTTGRPALGALLLQENVTATGKRPETQNARGAHHLIVIAAEEFLEVIEEGLDPPADRKDTQDRCRVGLQQAGHEVARLLQAGIRTRANDQNLTGTQLAHKGTHAMHKHRVAPRSRRPDVLRKLFGCQARRILLQAAIDRLALGLLTAQVAVAFETATDGKAALP